MCDCQTSSLEPSINLEIVDIVSSDHFFQVWAKYEDIAMHFNDLIIKIRTQALAAVAALMSFIIVKDQSPQSINVVTLFLFFSWIAIWILDTQYYSRLLSGAVDAILKMENKHPYIKISSEISNNYRCHSPRKTAHRFYGLVAVAILGIGLYSANSFGFKDLLTLPIQPK
jgi:hypothetical protein